MLLAPKARGGSLRSFDVPTYYLIQDTDGLNSGSPSQVRKDRWWSYLSVEPLKKARVILYISLAQVNELANGP